MFRDAVLIRMRAVQGVLGLSKKYGNARLDAACSRANHFGTPSLKVVKRILEKGLDQQADQTAVATYDIGQTVKEIQAAVSSSVMGMDKFSDEVRRGMDEVQQISGQLSQIIEQVQTLAPWVEEVNEGMQAQASGAEQITQALAQLNESAQQTVESLRQSSMAIDELHQVANGLRGGISRFKLHA